MTDLERLFKGIADQTRIRILNLLIHGELCVCDIQYVLESSQPNVSRHLTYLKHAGLVLDRRDGTRMYYRLAEPTEGVNKQLFAFLKNAFHASPTLVADLHRLKKAIQNGSCTVSEWKPYSALSKLRSSTLEKI